MHSGPAAKRGGWLVRKGLIGGGFWDGMYCCRGVVVVLMLVGATSLVIAWWAYALTGDAALAKRVAVWAAFCLAEAALLSLLVFLAAQAFHAGRERDREAALVLLPLSFVAGGALSLVGCLHRDFAAGEPMSGVLLARIAIVFSLAFPALAVGCWIGGAALPRGGKPYWKGFLSWMKHG